MSAVGSSILVMARAPRRGQVRRALEPVLGADRCLALHALLIAQAARWATEVADGPVHVAYSPPDAAAELRSLLPEDAVLFPQSGDGIAARLADASARVFARSSGPLLVVWPDVPVFRPGHADAALEDLRTGCDLVLGPVVDGGFYLVGLARPLQALFTVSEDSWRDADVMKLGFDAVARAGLELGLLRVERSLQRPPDVSAAVADPCLPAEVAKILHER